MPWTLALLHQPLACHSRFAPAPVRKTKCLRRLLLYEVREPWHSPEIFWSLLHLKVYCVALPSRQQWKVLQGSFQHTLPERMRGAIDPRLNRVGCFSCCSKIGSDSSLLRDPGAFDSVPQTLDRRPSKGKEGAWILALRNFRGSCLVVSASMPGKLLLRKELFGGVFCGEFVTICGILNFMLQISNFSGAPQKTGSLSIKTFSKNIVRDSVKLTKGLRENIPCHLVVSSLTK